MSVCGQSGQTEEDSASEEVGATIREKVSDTYKQKPASKVVRVLTVLAYLLSVSLAAILLSVYYVCVWKSPDLPPSEAAKISARIGNHTDYGDADHSRKPLPLYIKGGGDPTVNTSTTSPPENITSALTNTTVSDSTTDTSQGTTDLPDTTPQGLNWTSDDIGYSTFSDTDSIT